MGTALITGATSGIGLEIAWQLAEAHHDLVLVARTVTDLEEVAQRIRQVSGVDVQVLPADLSEPEDLARVVQRLRVASPPRSRPARGTHPAAGAPVEARPVDLLVNNAGFAVGQAFVGGGIEQERRAMAVLVGAVLELTHAAVPGMVERGHGAILNVASVAALTAMGTYAAHKAWVRTFTEALASELRGTGVSATVVNPGLTYSQFHERAGIAADSWPEAAWLRAEDVARAALTAVRRGQVICTPSARYLAANALLRVSPRWFVRRVAGHATQGRQY